MVITEMGDRHLEPVTGTWNPTGTLEPQNCLPSPDPDADSDADYAKPVTGTRNPGTRNPNEKAGEGGGWDLGAGCKGEEVGL
jgi:hypothetical protein